MAVVASVWLWSQAGQFCSKFALWQTANVASGSVWKPLWTTF